MKLYIIAGEASGDLHGSNLVKALKKKRPDLELQGWGGDLMQSEGVRVTKHYRELAFMGFVEVLMNIRTILRNFKVCKADIEAFAPDAIVLIDYPGFNLRMAKWASERGIRVIYYISPQVWAWKQNRVKDIRAYTDRMLVILPFEKDWFATKEVQVDFVGHPLLDVVSSTSHEGPSFVERNQLGDNPIIALLPGSRKQEIKRMLPVMLEAASTYPGYVPVIAGAPSQELSFYRSIAGDHVKVVQNDTYGLLSNARAGLITSGTATLEAALHRLPEVVLYKGSAISYAIARRLVKVKFISLVNLIMDREVVQELIQGECNPSTASQALGMLLEDSPARDTMLKDFDILKQKLGGPGASERAADCIVEELT